MENNQEEKKNEAIIPIKVGDIFYATFTFYDDMVIFYQVREIRKSIAIIQQIDSIQEFIDDKGCACYRSAIKDKFLDNSPLMRKKIQIFDDGKVHLKIDSWRYASLWDGKPCLVTV